jgi:hypothetical protein
VPLGLGFGGAVGTYGALLHVVNHGVTKALAFFAAGKAHRPLWLARHARHPRLARRGLVRTSATLTRVRAMHATGSSAALLNPVYDVRRLGIDFVASPRHAGGSRSPARSRATSRSPFAARF